MNNTAVRNPDSGKTEMGIQKLDTGIFVKNDFSSLTTDEAAEKMFNIFTGKEVLSSNELVAWYQFRKTPAGKKLVESAMPQIAHHFKTANKDLFGFSPANKIEDVKISGPAVRLLKALGKTHSDELSFKEAHEQFNQFFFRNFEEVKSGKTEFTNFSEKEIAIIKNFSEVYLELDKPILPIVTNRQFHYASAMVLATCHPAVLGLEVNLLFRCLCSFMTVDAILFLDSRNKNIPLGTKDAVQKLAEIFGQNAQNINEFKDRKGQIEEVLKAIGASELAQLGEIELITNSQEGGYPEMYKALLDDYTSSTVVVTHSLVLGNQELMVRRSIVPTTVVTHNPVYPNQAAMVQSSLGSGGQTIASGINAEVDFKIFDPEVREDLKEAYGAALIMKRIATTYNEYKILVEKELAIQKNEGGASDKMEI